MDATTETFIVRGLMVARFTGDTVAPTGADDLRCFKRMLRGVRANSVQLDLLAGRCARIGPLSVVCTTVARYSVQPPHLAERHPDNLARHFLWLCPECAARSTWRAGAEVST